MSGGRGTPKHNPARIAPQSAGRAGARRRQPRYASSWLGVGRSYVRSAVLRAAFPLLWVFCSGPLPRIFLYLRRTSENPGRLEGPTVLVWIPGIPRAPVPPVGCLSEGGPCAKKTVISPDPHGPPEDFGPRDQTHSPCPLLEPLEKRGCGPG